MGSTSVLDSITAVFEAMADWLIGIIPTITGIFILPKMDFPFWAPSP